MTVHFVGGQGAMWAQPYGPNTSPVYLGCHAVGDLDEPSGDVTLLYCQDASGPNKFKVIGSLKGAAGAVTTTITTDVTDEFDPLERVKENINIFVMQSERGRKDVFDNYDRAWVLAGSSVTNRGASNLIARTQDDNDRSTQTFEISAQALLRIARHTVGRQTSGVTVAINDVTFCNEEQMQTEDTQYLPKASIGYAVADAGTGAKAKVLYTSDGGGTWTATAADAFANDEHIMAVECFDLGRDSVRIIIARGVTDAANPPEVALTDDMGATWALVDVGTVDAGFVASPNAMYALDRNNIWLATNDGYIYKSVDGGATWAAQEAGVINTGIWNAIHFYNEEVGLVGGAANKQAKSIDGGNNWTALTGPTAEAANAVNTVFAVDKKRYWVGYSSGKLYYTLDGGVTWVERGFSGSGTGAVKSVRFVSPYVGYLVHNTAAPVGSVLFTFNGGYSWEKQTVPANSGFNSVFAADEWKYFVVGEANTSSGFIALGEV